MFGSAHKQHSPPLFSNDPERQGSLDALMFQSVDKERHADLHKLSSTDNTNETKVHKY
jgi:hypothetical protein